MKYRDLPYTEKEKIVSLVFEEAKRMKRLNGDVNYHELSRIVLAKTCVTLHHEVIRRWFTKKRAPLKPVGQPPKATRRPPDEDAQIVRGLSITDLYRDDEYRSIRLTLTTTKDFFAMLVQRFLARYGWADVKPRLISVMPEWQMRASLSKPAWAHELKKPIHELTRDEKLKLLSGAISGDGWITLNNINQDLIVFLVIFSSTQRHKAHLFHKVLESLSIPHTFTKNRIGGRRAKIGDRIIQTKAPYDYKVIVAARSAVKYLLTNLQLLQPYRETKRDWLFDLLTRVYSTAILLSPSGIG